ncbi:hypothetical protein [Streptomyces virginiae]|uniref:hypothetical protein n=1 Tax=Streptomyces virginiae TaxID=1961 RepID=UPI003660B071
MGIRRVGPVDLGLDRARRVVRRSGILGFARCGVGVGIGGIRIGVGVVRGVGGGDPRRHRVPQRVPPAGSGCGPGRGFGAGLGFGLDFGFRLDVGFDFDIGIGIGIGIGLDIDVDTGTGAGSSRGPAALGIPRPEHRQPRITLRGRLRRPRRSFIYRLVGGLARHRSSSIAAMSGCPNV